MKQNHNTKVLTETSIWINKNNRQLLKGRRQQPANRQEIIKNLVQQNHILPIGKTRGSWIFRRGMIVLWALGFSNLILIMFVSLAWFGISIAYQRISSEAFFYNTIAILASMWLIYHTKDGVFYMGILIFYPIIVRDMYQELIDSGQITAIEQMDMSQTKIRYSFRQPEMGITFSSSYITTVSQTFSVNQNIAVFFLPSRRISIVL
ncbi:MAG: hypothetical protein JW963_11485 [Anaerolineales bacterium]|nr:hypothetical protein [Anaerolineales bacterium]